MPSSLSMYISIFSGGVNLDTLNRHAPDSQIIK
jgi:hypothetical protein